MKIPTYLLAHFWAFIRTSLALGLVTLIWAFALHLVAHTDRNLDFVSPADLTTTLFATASLGLFIFTSVVSMLFVAGWQLGSARIRQLVTETVDNRLRILENEVKGRQLTAVGFMMGEMSLQKGSLEPKDRETLEFSLRYCQEAYEILSPIGGPSAYTALNNLIYFTCAFRDSSKKDFLLTKARELKRIGQEYNIASFLLTACRAVLQYGNNEQEKKEARETLSHLLATRLSERELREARLYLASFPEP